MAIDSQQAVAGFIATEPRLTYSDDGVPRFYARNGIGHSRQERDGSFTQLEPTFHDMSPFRRAAEEGATLFRKGDKFIATGRGYEYTYEKNGRTVKAEEFIVSRFGHDLARTRYEVDRSAHRGGATQETTVAHLASFETPTQAHRQANPAAALGI